MKKQKTNVLHLTPQHMDFCRYYLENGGEPERASLAAGFKPGYGDKLFKRPEIQAYLQKCQKRAEDKFDITIEWKMKKLRTCIVSMIPNEDGEGMSKLSTKKANIVIKAIQELNRMQGHHSPAKVQVEDLSSDPQIISASLRLREIVVQFEKEY